MDIVSSSRGIPIELGSQLHGTAVHVRETPHTHQQQHEGRIIMTTPPVVRIGFGDYDHTRDLWNGRVTVPECELDCTPVDNLGEVFRRFLEGGEWDAAELPLATVTAMLGQGDDSLVVLPVFPARSFRHGTIYVHKDGPQNPEDLAGKRIGIPTWAQTTGIVVRGMLASEYGVDLNSISWIQPGAHTSERKETTPLDVPGFDVTRVDGTTLDQLLLGGEVDAVISTRPPVGTERRDSPVRRMFEKWTFEEMSYTRKTGLYPIMHVLALRRAVYEAEPSVYTGLVKAFTDAKDRAVKRAKNTTVPSYPLPWAPSNMLRTKEFLGDDFWPYGIEANLPTIEKFLDDCAQQSVTPRRLSIDELFAQEAAHSY
jgi:4,5-dihydroxyphthalate decarboxylase